MWKNTNSLLFILIFLLKGLSAPLLAQFPDNSTITVYEFDRTYGDSSGLNNHGTNQGSQFNRNRCFLDSNAIKFDGVNDYVNLDKMDSLSANLNSFSISLWFKSAPEKQEWESIIKTLNNGGSMGFSIEINRGPSGYTNGYLGAFIRDNNGTVLSLPIRDTGINDCEWHHYVLAVEDASTNKAKVYLDGTERNILPNFVKDGPNSFVAFNYDLVLGAGNNRGTIEKHFAGSLDDVFIFKGDLDTNEVKQLYHFNCGAKCADTLTTVIRDTLSYVDTSYVTDTTYLVINDTNHVTIFDTTWTIIQDTNYISIFDTTRIVVNDTLRISVFDTTTVVLHDTIRVTLFDTLTHTDTTTYIVHDTLYHNLCDTLVLAYSDSGCIHGNMEIRLFPNSAKDVIFVKFSEDDCFTDYRIQIHDAIGRQVYSGRVVSRKSSIDLYSYAQGTYLLSVFNDRGGRVGTRRFIIRR